MFNFAFVSLVATTILGFPANDPGAVFRSQRTCPPTLQPKGNANPNLLQFAPNLGARAGLSDPVCQSGSGDRLSDVKQGVRIPCDCPPNQDDFNRQFVVDHGADIKTAGSAGDKRRNLELAIITLQNSFCCPAGSVTLNAQLSNVNNVPAPQPAPQPQAPNQQVPTNIGRNDPGAVFRAKRVCPAPLQGKNGNPDLAKFAPNLGARAGLSDPVCQSGNGDRLSDVKQGVRVPCDCPPAQNDFAKQFAFDHGPDIKTDGSAASVRRNIELAIVTLQNSFCCPAGAVTLNAQLASVGNSPAPQTPPAPQPPTPQAPTNTGGRTDPGAVFRAKRVCPASLQPKNGSPDLARFAPNLGAKPGLSDPVCQSGNGDRQSDVKPVRVPCDCPPSQADFSQQFATDHGSDIKTDNSNASKRRNIELAIITLQSSFCCPAGSVTLNAQLSAL